ncbi:hypothetical protein S58_11300 [Bradyrhizobium oligotrophicum S58]|uniref:Uncharacterized protein n=1 Tax=Bradyrhizobium oligotrophicum S58 TaxID=1245469 RepID=M4ZLP8_9BRAD|nr:hypothetical protein S58_11300 [Bradyrhizobium oligotrophicum S58]
MTNSEDFEDRARKERSPSYPFISLPKALERAKAFDEAHRRSAARLATVAGTWGYSPSSSGLLQTASALKAYGLLEDSGRGDDRKVQLSDLAQRILHDARPGAREAAIREAAMRPRLFSEYGEKWLPQRPSDSHCLSELRLDRGFTEAAASLFLRSFDETVAFSGLKEIDKSSNDLDQDGQAVAVNLGRSAPMSTQLSSASGVGLRGARMGTYPHQTGSGAQAQEAGIAMQPPRATLPLPEGMAALEIPQRLSRKSWEALRAWTDLMVSLSEPMPDHLRSQAGDSSGDRHSGGDDEDRDSRD